MAQDAKYETFKKAIIDLLSAKGEASLLATVTEMAADVDRLSSDDDQAAGVSELEAFNKMGLTQKGELFKSNPEKFNELLALSKK